MSLQNDKRHTRFPKKTIHNPRKRQAANSKHATNTFQRDLLAMKQVWKMLKTGTIRWFGEVGRQY